MPTAFAPRTCTRCFADYTAKPRTPAHKAHRFGICADCKGVKKIDPWPMRDYSTIEPISDRDDDTRPVWSMPTNTQVVLLLPGDLGDLMKRLGRYWHRRFGIRMDVRLELDDAGEPTGRGWVLGPDSGKVRARFRMTRIESEAA